MWEIHHDVNSTTPWVRVLDCMRAGKAGWAANMHAFILLDVCDYNQLKGKPVATPMKVFLVRLFEWGRSAPKCGQHLLVTAQIKGHRRKALLFAWFLSILLASPSALLLHHPFAGVVDTDTGKEPAFSSFQFRLERSAILWECCSARLGLFLSGCFLSHRQKTMYDVQLIFRT